MSLGESKSGESVQTTSIFMITKETEAAMNAEFPWFPDNTSPLHITQNTGLRINSPALTRAKN